MKVGVTEPTRVCPALPRTLVLEVVRGAAHLTGMPEVTRPGGLRIRVWRGPPGAPAGSALRGAIAGVLACVGEVWLPEQLGRLVGALEPAAVRRERPGPLIPGEVEEGALAGMPRRRGPRPSPPGPF